MLVLQVVSNEDCFYALPRPDALQESLGDVLVPSSKDRVACKFGRKNKSNQIFDDSVDHSESSALPGSGTARMMAFRLVHATPKNQKLMNRLCKLRGDHMAVTMYPIHECNGEAQTVSLADQSGGAHHTKLISAKTLLSLGWERVAKLFIECKFESSTYAFSAPLPPVCHSLEAREIVSMLMVAEAYPGPYGTLTLTTSWDDDAKSIVQKFVDAGMVLDLSGRYQISELGYSCLQQFRDCTGKHRVMVPRAHLDAKDHTHWELIFTLHVRGWRALPATGHATKPVPTKDPSEDDMRWYFSPKSLEASHTYFLALVKIDEVAARGAQY